MRPARLTAVDERIIDPPRDATYRVLHDFGSYAEWWPRATRPHVVGPLPTQIGTTIRLSNGPFVRWNAHVVDLRAPALIAMQYTGALRGAATWRLATHGTGTRVSYEIDVEPAVWWLRLAFALWNLQAEHSRQIGRVFDGLDLHLRTTMSRASDRPSVAAAALTCRDPAIPGESKR